MNAFSLPPSYFDYHLEEKEKLTKTEKYKLNRNFNEENLKTYYNTRNRDLVTIEIKRKTFERLKNHVRYFCKERAETNDEEVIIRLLDFHLNY